MTIDDRDALARRRLQLRKVFHTRLGMPDRLDVLDPAGKLLGTIVATEGAIEITGGRLAGGRSHPFRVEFGGE